MPDPTAGRQPDAAEPKRVRTAWRFRQRYRLAQRLATLAGAVLALGLIAVALARLPEPSAALERDVLVPAALFVLLCAGLPWLVIGALWRRTYLRNRHEWSESALF